MIHKIKEIVTKMSFTSNNQNMKKWRGIKF